MIKQHAQYALRKMMYGALAGKIVISSVTIPVYDNVSPNAPEPFIKIGTCRWNLDNVGTKDSSYSDVFHLNIEVYTEYGGSMLCSQIIGEVIKIISTDDKAGTLCIDSPFRIIEFELESGEQRTAIDMEDEEGYIQYGFRIIQTQ
jgi:hypothetical protein